MGNELKRQGMHLLLGVFYIIILFFLVKPEGLLVIAAILAFGLIVSATHAHLKPSKFLGKMLEHFERSGEENLPGKGALLFTAGALLSALVFYPFSGMVAVGAVTALTFGDGFSTIIGRAVGKTRIVEGRTLEGTLAGIAAASLALAVFFPPETALAAALFGMLAEYLPVNDNFSIPLASGAVLALLV